MVVTWWIVVFLRSVNIQNEISIKSAIYVSKLAYCSSEWLILYTLAWTIPLGVIHCSCCNLLGSYTCRDYSVGCNPLLMFQSSWLIHLQRLFSWV